MKHINSIRISGSEVLPIIEGGKGVSATNGLSAGAFAAAGAVGTFSTVITNYIDENGKKHQFTLKGSTRNERHAEVIANSINGGIAQARVARQVSGGKGKVHMNILWEVGGAQDIIKGILDGAKGLVDGVTCGAGMPYKLADIAQKYNVYYYPIVSSARAFGALWKRSYQRVANLLGGVVYEDPWVAGGHNGLSNKEDPQKPENPYGRVKAIRDLMNQCGLDHVPIIMAGGVWFLRDWQNWIDSKDLGLIAFQFGTRPLLTQESPVPDSWKKKLMELREPDVILNRFSPTGFYSSAVRNSFLRELEERSNRQVRYASSPEGELSHAIPFGGRGRLVYLSAEDKSKSEQWAKEGYTAIMKTPDDTLIFVTPERQNTILNDQIGCRGCLSHCLFSNWKDSGDHTTGRKPDPRSFCIHKTLHDIIDNGDVDNNLLFSGKNGYLFHKDPFYANGFIPTVKQLVDRILTGD